MRELPSSDADEVQTQAGAWIARRDEASWSEVDQAELDVWLAQSTANMIAFVRLDDMWKRADRLQALTPSSKGDGTRLYRFFSRTFALKAIAATIVVGIGATVFLYQQRPVETIYATPVGGHKLLRLADGSSIDLNTDTELRLSNHGNRVTVRLEKGEAFFRIKHDPHRLFVVLAGRHRVTDLGTEFLVRSQPNRMEVALLTGSARLDAPDGRMQTPILMAPGDELTIANNLITTTKKTSRLLGEELGWRRGMLIFENAPLADVVAEFNRYGTRKIVVADREAARIPLSASFPTDGIDGFLELAKAMLNVKVQKRGDEIVISR